MLLKLMTVPRLKSYFPELVFEKGENYYFDSNVSNLKQKFNANQKEETITATVIGNKAYTVIVKLTGPANKIRIHGACSCPMALNCKHVVATLLEAMDEKKVLNDLVPGFISPPEIKRDPMVDNWLRDFNRYLAEEKTVIQHVDETYCLFYILAQPIGRHLTGLEVKLSLVRRLKAGGWGTPKDFSRTAYAHHKHLYPIDNELLVKLDVASRLTPHSGSYHQLILNGEQGEKILPELIATGRCCWRSPQNPPLTLSTEKAAELEWKIDENGFQELYYTAQGAPLFVFIIDQLWYLDQTKSQLGLVETSVDKQVAKFLLKTPKIPPQHAKEVVEFLAKHEKTTKIQQPKVFEKKTAEKIKPIPCLRLFQTTLKFQGDYRDHWQILNAEHPVAELTFDYQGAAIAWMDSREIFNHINHQELRQIIRNKKEELDAFDQLVEFELTPIQYIQPLSALNQGAGNYFSFNHDSDPLYFSAEALPVLREAGWRIDIDSDYPYQIVNGISDEWYSSIDESSDYNWFGIELGITLNDEKINLLPVLHDLLKKFRIHNSTELTDYENVLARLPDGRYIQLPAERVRNILSVLIELYDSESLTDDNMLKLSYLHATRLEELEKACGDAAKLRWFGGEKTRQLGAKLAQFKGIETAKVPAEFKGELRPYQLEGLSWLQFLREYGLSGILADDMGLGKTIQALAHISLEKTSGRMQAPCLVVAPTSLMFNWRMEAERFSPHLNVLVLHGTDRKQQFNQIAQYDLILTTYPLLVHDKDILLKQNFYLLILDEAQFIKNSKSQSTQIALQIKAVHRLCLTGTPMENHLGELWSLFHFLMPGLLGEQEKFNRLFRKPIEKLQNEERRKHLNRRIAPFLLRRAKNEVVKELPDKIEIIRHVELEGAQRDLYETIRMTMQKKVRQEIAKLGLARSHIIILDALLKLRQVCCDPRLLKIATTKKQQEKSAKLELLLDLISELLEEGRRILVFSQFTEMLKLIENELNKKNVSYVKLTGQTKDRETPVQQFQAGKAPLFLISLKAGGTGLNLTTADTVIHYDPWWNPAVENQATDRAHRIGQQKTVFVYKFVSTGTVEEKILDMQKRKHAIMEGLFSEKTTA
jgi:SNF2 family DNA or RNA helicase